ncbi:MAG: hypothetical protein NVS2B5_10670 [Beijerinckiaceae bacterium]
MSYGKLAQTDLRQGVSVTKKAIKSCEDLVEMASKNPDIKGLQKLSKSASKGVHRLERDLEKLERALAKNSKSLSVPKTSSG